jgi:hypothetical protein
MILGCVPVFKCRSLSPRSLPHTSRHAPPSQACCTWRLVEAVLLPSLCSGRRDGPVSDESLPYPKRRKCSGRLRRGDEFIAGLLSLGILQEKTLPYSPHQNAKQERLWGTMEGRLMEMLEGVELTLEFLNEATQAYPLTRKEPSAHRPFPFPI